MSTASVRAQHSEWVSALDGDGPWLTVPALTQGLDAGLIPTTPQQNQALRRAWTTNITAEPGRTADAQQNWIRSVVTDVLGWGDHADFAHAVTWAHTDPVHGITVTPGFALLPEPASSTAGAMAPVLLGFIHPVGTPLTNRVGDGWATTPIDRAAHALRAADVPLGLITDGRWWAVLWAPRSKDGAAATPGYALWSTDLLLDDELLRSAFTTLLSRHRSLAVAEAKTLRGLFEQSGESQEDITENLSLQTRKAVELLVDAFSTANNRAAGAYLDGVAAEHVYQGAVTVMMRLLFTLAAEERRLLPGDDDFYTRTYSVAALADQIISRGNLDGEDLLADTYTAFPQILATTRVIHDGIHHNRLNIPGYGGSVFDPHRFPWLETATGNPALGPIGVDDRTMLHILRGLTRWEGRRLSFRTLDVEQIGYAYEGLLDHTAILATAPVLGLIGKKEPEVTLDDLEVAAARGTDHLMKWLKDLTGDTPAQINSRLPTGTPGSRDAGRHQQLVSACAGDSRLAERVTPWLPLLRTDERTGLPIVINEGTVFVTASGTRGDTGTHYTPKSLAEDVVKTALDALVYSPGPLNTNDQNAWHPIDPEEIIDLKIADIAMGSGAFLVAGIRYLADRLLDAIDVVERDAITTPALQEVWDLAHRVTVKAEWDESRDDETLLAARALVAARSIYGVDINPMAVEMAKLSIWLVTASRNKPFSFLDHRLKAGDSLLGLQDVRQLENLHLDPARGAEIYGGGESKLLDFTTSIRSATARISELHAQIEKKRILDTHDVDEQSHFFADAEEIRGDLDLIASGLSAASLAAAVGGNRTRRRVFDAKTAVVQQAVEKLLATSSPSMEVRDVARQSLAKTVQDWLAIDLPAGADQRVPLNFPLQFPEVFVSQGARGGFDAVVGNPPFLGGTKISGPMGVAYRHHLAMAIVGEETGRADLSVFFLHRAVSLVAREGMIGLITTSGLVQGASRRFGLDALLAEGCSIFAARTRRSWSPRSANVSVVVIWLTKREVQDSALLDGLPVTSIASSLEPASRSQGQPFPLNENRGRALQGSKPAAKYFFLEESIAKALIAEQAGVEDVVRPFIIGDDLGGIRGRINRWVVFFDDMLEAEASRYSGAFQTVAAACIAERGALVARDQKGWWQFSRPASEVYRSLVGQNRAIVIPETSVHSAPVMVETGPVFGNTVVVIFDDSMAKFGVLSSRIHREWCLRHGTSLGASPRYQVAQCYLNFPFPPASRELDAASQAWLLEFERLTIVRPVTEVMNQFHAGSDTAVEKLRRLSINLESSVAMAYGWSDLDLEMAPRQTPHGTRWAFSDRSRVEILDRLLELNHRRHTTEVAAGLVDVTGKPLKNRSNTRKTAAARSRPGEGQFGMFEVEGT